MSLNTFVLITMQASTSTQKHGRISLRFVFLISLKCDTKAIEYLMNPPSLISRN